MRSLVSLAAAGLVLLGLAVFLVLTDTTVLVTTLCIVGLLIFELCWVVARSG